MGPPRGPSPLPFEAPHALQRGACERRPSRPATRCPPRRSLPDARRRAWGARPLAVSSAWVSAGGIRRHVPGPAVGAAALLRPGSERLSVLAPVGASYIAFTSGSDRE